MTDDLCKRLREHWAGRPAFTDHGVIQDAADRIERLEAQVAAHHRGAYEAAAHALDTSGDDPHGQVDNIMGALRALAEGTPDAAKPSPELVRALVRFFAEAWLNYVCVIDTDAASSAGLVTESGGGRMALTPLGRAAIELAEKPE